MLASAFWKHALLATAGIACSLLVTDLLGHAYYRLRHGVFIWDASADRVFRVPRLADPVKDERGLVPKKNLRTPDVETDSNGFRIGSNEYQGRETNIVFIGDSVPFGWGVIGTESVPSHLARLLLRDGKTRIGVINAAVPSYTLYQAAKRYEYDVHGRFPVTAVVVQTWDPVEQLVRHGPEWTRDMSWYTGKSPLTSFERVLVANREWTRYSSLIQYGIRWHLGLGAHRFSVNDAQTRATFVAENRRTLEELRKLVEPQGASLYLLPANPTNGVPATLDPVPTALRWLNESLRDYAATAPKVHFVDIVKRFDEIGRNGLFIDECCHLSDAGARLEAETIYDAMVLNGGGSREPTPAEPR